MTLFDTESGAAAPRSVTPAETCRVRMVVAYLGTGFRGFAIQPGQTTVAGVLTHAIERHLRHTVELVCAGRTDAGVHAWGQVVSFDARADVELAALGRAVNRTLRPAIVVRDVEAVPNDFDARRSARSRRYRYTILNRGLADPFTASTTWHVSAPLDLRAMRLGTDPFFGEHDFSSFCRRPPSGSVVRVVTDARWVQLADDQLRFDIEATSFCQQMVRAIVGTLVDVGRGKKRAGEVAGIIRARDRGAAGQLAPPHGLCLWEVGYDDTDYRPVVWDRTCD